MTVGSINTKERPVVSIITVVFNAINTIEATIQSVINQTYKNIEFIIIDGGSTDGTIDVIQKYRDRISYYVSEPDNGIYDAMNKGINKSTGDWLYFLGADDELVNEDIIKSIFDQNLVYLDKYQLIFGDIQQEDGRLFQSRLDASIKSINTVHHQGAFYNSKLFKSFKYENRFSVFADYKLKLIIYLRNYPYLKTNKIIARCSQGGVSTKKIILYHIQHIRIRNKHLPLEQCFAYNYWSILEFFEILKCTLKIEVKKILNFDS